MGENESISHVMFQQYSVLSWLLSVYMCSFWLFVLVISSYAKFYVVTFLSYYVLSKCKIVTVTFCHVTFCPTFYNYTCWWRCQNGCFLKFCFLYVKAHWSISFFHPILMVVSSLQNCLKNIYNVASTNAETHILCLSLDSPYKTRYHFHYWRFNFYIYG